MTLDTDRRLAGVLFDLDGALVDSRAPFVRCVHHALEVHGLRLPPAESLHRYLGPPLHGSFVEILGAQGADPALADACLARYRERYARAAVEETTLVPGVGEVVRALSRRVPVAVATSKPEAFARPILETLGLADALRAIVGPSLHARAEAKRETVARALRAVGLAPGPSVAIVGDRSHDVEAGRAHGLLTVGVTWGIGAREELEESGADHVVDRPEALLALLLARVDQNDSLRRSS